MAEGRAGPRPPVALLGAGGHRSEAQVTTMVITEETGAAERAFTSTYTDQASRFPPKSGCWHADHATIVHAERKQCQ